jgi:uncharacterized protein (TIGR03083 family)
MSPQPRAASTSGPTLVAAFRECWASMSALGHTLSEEQWESPSLCPGWRCKDALVHVTSAELGFADWTPAPEPPFEVIGNHVRELRRKPGAEVLATFEAITARRGEQLTAMTDDEFGVVCWSPAGQNPYRRYMEIRVFDHWAHEQDLRVPLGLPGHHEGLGATISLDEAHIAFGYLIGKRAALPDGASVSVHVTGPVGLEGRARVVDELDAPACEVTTDFLTFMLLCCGRIDPSGPLEDGRVVLGGDVAMAEQVARNLAFTI